MTTNEKRGRRRGRPIRKPQVRIIRPVKPTL